MKQVLAIALLVLAAASARAAVGVSEAVPEIVSTSNSAQYSFGSFTPAAGATLVVIVAASGTVDDGEITNTSGTALAWTRAGSRAYNAGADTIYLWWARTGGSTAASVYTVDFTGDNATGCVAMMFQVTGADQATANPIRQFAFNNATSTNATTGTLGVATLTGSALIAGWSGQLSSSNPANVSTPPTGWTEIADAGYATPTSTGAGAYRAGGGTATSYSFTNNSTNWGLVFVEIYEAGAGPQGMLRRGVTWN